MAKHHVVIVGGGFAGTKAALSLAKDHRFEVTLISDHPDFRYYPSLYQTATGGKKMISSIPLKQIFERLPIHILIDTLKDIDRKAQTVVTKSGKKIHYDGLVLALGVKTNFFNIKGLEEFSFGIKTLDDAERLKQHLHKQLADDAKPDVNYVVVGGGPTGVELAAALPSYIRKLIKKHGLSTKKIHIDLVEAAPRILPKSPRKMSRMVTNHLRRLGIKIYVKTQVRAESADELMVNDKPIKSHTVIWTAGVSNHPFFAEHGFQLSGNGKVRVNQYLQTEPAIYILGDNADTPYSGMAQTAIYDGKFVAENLKLLASGQEPIPYKAKRPIYAFAAGPEYSAILWGHLQVYGIAGSWLRRMADLVGYHDFEPWHVATKLLIAEFESEESCPTCAND